MSLNLEIYKLNKHGCRIVPADTTLLGQAHKDALKFCGPFTHANSAGWWVYPPIDLDVSYDGKGNWQHKISSVYPNYEVRTLLESAVKFGSKSINVEEAKMGVYDLAKSKYSFGNVEPDVFQFWTGCIFKLPPGWSLLVTNPVNIATNRPFSVQQGILEVDWLRTDHWLNFKWNSPGSWANIRIDQKEPIAQLIPIPRESYDRTLWKVVEKNLYDSEEVFKEWDEYYYQKFVKNLPEKDSSTYHRTRKENVSKCPYHQKILKN